MHKSRTNHDFI